LGGEGKGNHKIPSKGGIKYACTVIKSRRGDCRREKFPPRSPRTQNCFKTTNIAREKTHQKKKAVRDGDGVAPLQQGPCRREFGGKTGGVPI